MEEHKLYFFNTHSYLEDNLDHLIHECIEHSKLGEVKVEKNKLDYKFLNPYFNWLPEKTIKNAFSLTTQHSRIPSSTMRKKNFKSQIPAFNIKH